MWTFDFIKDNFISAQDRSLWDELVEVEFDGGRLGDVVLEMRTPSPNEVQISQKHAELRILAEAVLRAGDTIARIYSQERPDFRVTLASGLEAFVEVAEAVGAASARYHNTLFSLLRDLRDRIDSDNALGTAIKPYFVTFTLADVPAKIKRGAVLDELSAFISDENLSTFDPMRLVAVSATYPCLAALACRVNVAEGTGRAFVTSTAHAFDPRDLTKSALDILQDKRTKAKDYSGKPLWLVIGMTDLSGYPAISLRQMSEIAPGFAPFDRLIVLADREVISWP